AGADQKSARAAGPVRRAHDGLTGQRSAPPSRLSASWRLSNMRAPRAADPSWRGRIAPRCPPRKPKTDMRPTRAKALLLLAFLSCAVSAHAQVFTNKLVGEKGR